VESVLGHHARLMADDGHTVRVLAGRGAQIDPRIPFVLIPLADSRHPDILAAKAALDAGRLPDDFTDLATCLENTIVQSLNGIDLLIAHNICSLHKNLPLTAALWQLKQRPGMPGLMLWHHDLAWTTPRYRTELHPGYPWDLLRNEWPGAIQVVVSETRRRGLLNFPHPTERIRVIPRRDPSQFMSRKRKRATRRAVQPVDRGAVAYPANDHAAKNIELALRIRACGRISHRGAGRHRPARPTQPRQSGVFHGSITLRADLGLVNSLPLLNRARNTCLTRSSPISMPGRCLASAQPGGGLRHPNPGSGSGWLTDFLRRYSAAA
jgi:hypothetical protein